MALRPPPALRGWWRYSRLVGWPPAPASRAPPASLAAPARNERRSPWPPPSGSAPYSPPALSAPSAPSAAVPSLCDAMTGWLGPGWTCPIPSTRSATRTADSARSPAGRNFAQCSYSCRGPSVHC